MKLFCDINLNFFISFRCTIAWRRKPALHNAINTHKKSHLKIKRFFYNVIAWQLDKNIRPKWKQIKEQLYLTTDMQNETWVQVCSVREVGTQSYICNSCFASLIYNNSATRFVIFPHSGASDYIYIHSNILKSRKMHFFVKSISYRLDMIVIFTSAHYILRRLKLSITNSACVSVTCFYEVYYSLSYI
jgi:hypothetical protein